MRLPVDDEIYNVNSVWLGPPGRTLPFRARYVAYAVGAVVFVLLQVARAPARDRARLLRPGLQPACHGRRSPGCILARRRPRPPARSASCAPSPTRSARRARTRSHDVPRIRPARVRAVPSRPSRAHGLATRRSAASRRRHVMSARGLAAAPDQRPLHRQRRQGVRLVPARAAGLVVPPGRGPGAADRRRRRRLRPARQAEPPHAGHDPALPGQPVGRSPRRERPRAAAGLAST